MQRLTYHETISDKRLGHVDGELDSSDRIYEAVVEIEEVRHGLEIMTLEKERFYVDVDVEGHMLANVSFSYPLDTEYKMHAPRERRQT